MMARMMLSCVLCLSVVLHLSTAQELVYLGSLPLEKPGFPALFDHGEDVTDPTERYSVLVGTFILEERQNEVVYGLKYPGKCMETPENCTLEPLTTGLKWPREPGQVPANAFGTSNYISVPDGFIPPGYNNGAMYISDITNPDDIITTDISTVEGEVNWFYQRILWKDADGDGILDAFTCRTNIQPVPPAVNSQFLWYKNSGEVDAPRTGPWEIGHVISENDCDTFVEETRLTVGDVDYDVIFTTGYFMNKFSVHWNAEGLWDNSTQIQSRVLGSLIDDLDCVPGEGLCGHFFDFVIADVNNDGRLDIAMTINSGVYGNVVVYEIPDDFRNDPFEPILVAEGFVPRVGNDNEGSPGFLQIFKPTPSTTGKPWIGITGDDDGRFYYARPLSEDPTNWEYDLVEVYDGGAGLIMGGPMVLDANGDGYADWFQMVYSDDEIRFYTFVD